MNSKRPKAASAPKRRLRGVVKRRYMKQVTVIAKFTTGTTMDDAEKAVEYVKKLLLNKLKENRTAEQFGSNGLFQVRILDVETASL